MTGTLNPDALYRQLGRAIETMPPFAFGQAVDDNVIMWLARAEAILDELSDQFGAGDIRSGTRFLNSQMGHEDGVRMIKLALHRAMAKLAHQVPEGVAGAFIPTGSSFDAFAAFRKIVARAKKDILIVDPYMDESVLTDFVPVTPDGIPVRLLADGFPAKPLLEVAARRWIEQHKDARPLELRLSPDRALHDRAVFIDSSTAWTLTQSLKDFARRSPGEFIDASYTASLKIPAYEDIWSKSRAAS